MRDEEELQKLYDDCMKYWGFRRQARMVQEECAELIIAISHLLRDREDGIDKAIEETADVYLMTQQMMHYFGKEKVMSIVDFKSDRTRAKLDKYKNKDIELRGC